jgi:hypothetical protein
MIVHKISAADTLSKDVKKLQDLECMVQIRITAHAHDSSTPSSGMVYADL